MSDHGDGASRADRDSRQRDKDEFREEPRGREEASEQQPETQPGEPGQGSQPENGRRHGREQAGRDDPGEASGNPPSAG
ncbi:MAG TPA: hypothetical protein VGR10_00755 [Thermoleophilaceae bacterium]|nr:hypothetical protein [Thermoleophilaceae bacterium]